MIFSGGHHLNGHAIEKVNPSGTDRQIFHPA